MTVRLRSATRASACSPPRVLSRFAARAEASIPCRRRGLTAGGAILPAAVLLLSVCTAPAKADPQTFDEALARAASSAPRLRASALSVDAARAAAPAAGLLPDPRLTVGLDGYPVTGPFAGQLDEDFTMLRIGVEQEVPSRARRRAERDIAEAAIGVAGAEESVARREVRVAAGLAWIDLFYAERRLAALDALLATLQPLWDAAPAGVASGAYRPANALGPVQLKAALDDRRSGLAADIDKARAELARWTGDAEPETVGPPPQDELDGVALQSGVTQLPTVRAFGAAARRAEAEVDLARAGRRLDWSFQASYARRDERFGDLFSVGASVRLPIFPGQRQDPVIAARAADALRVTAERQDAERALIASLRSALAEHAAARDQWLRSRDVVLPTVLQRSELETASYAAGRAGIVDVLEAFTAVADARLDTLDREAAVMRQVVEITLTYGNDDR
ncbi:TolC family protein [Brevundimonas aurantiaca]|uniref:TolC family protein n=1 Tax=Brevundimonas aurantiaca TaxID=74316 RepID=UPI00160493EA|nr:transporter [Pseudomonas sp. FW305-3-2-15-E-TSA4]